MKTVLKIGGVVLAAAATATAGWFGKKFHDKKKNSKTEIHTETTKTTTETKTEE